MPDFTVVHKWACSSVLSWSTIVPSSKPGVDHLVSFGRMPPGAQYEYGWSCSCAGFKFRKTCNHVKAIEGKPFQAGGRCGWDAMWEDGETTKEAGCPRCGGEVFSMGHAV